MKHIKTFETYKLNENAFLTTLGILALLKILRDIIRRKRIIGGLKKNDFSQLEYFVKGKGKELIGEVIDNPQECQIVYEFGSSDNVISFHLDKIEKTFSFSWNFTMPIIPFIKYSDTDKLKNIELTDEEYDELYEVFKKIKSQQFTD
jgi:hypothetical protein